MVTHVLVSWRRLQSFHEKVSLLIFHKNDFVKMTKTLTTFIYPLAQYTNQGLVTSTASVDHLFDIDIETFSSDVVETMLTAFGKDFDLINFLNNNFTISEWVSCHVSRVKFTETKKSLVFILESHSICWLHNSSKWTYIITDRRSSHYSLMIISQVSKVWFRFKFSSCNKVPLLTWNTL